MSKSDQHETLPPDVLPEGTQVTADMFIARLRLYERRMIRTSVIAISTVGFLAIALVIVVALAHD